MEQLIGEHGSVIVSGIVSVMCIIIITGIIYATGKMDAYELGKIIG